MRQVLADPAKRGTLLGEDPSFLSEGPLPPEQGALDQSPTFRLVQTVAALALLVLFVMIQPSWKERP